MPCPPFASSSLPTTLNLGVSSRAWAHQGMMYGTGALSGARPALASVGCRRAERSAFDSRFSFAAPKPPSQARCRSAGDPTAPFGSSKHCEKWRCGLGSRQGDCGSEGGRRGGGGPRQGHERGNTWLVTLGLAPALLLTLPRNTTCTTQVARRVAALSASAHLPALAAPFLSSACTPAHPSTRPLPCSDLNGTGLWGTLPSQWGTGGAFPKLDSM